MQDTKPAQAVGLQAQLLQKEIASWTPIVKQIRLRPDWARPQTQLRCWNSNHVQGAPSSRQMRIG
jgi:hypothetical protein